MNYLIVELRKITKSIEARLSYLFVFIVILSIMIGFKSNTATSNFSRVDMLFVSLGNFSRYIMFHMVLIMIASQAIANEFSQGTFRYIMIRPVSLSSLLLGKYVAMWLYAGIILLLVTAVSFITGTLLFSPGVLHGDHHVILSIPVLRFLLFYSGTWINALFMISFTTLFAVIIKNHLNTVVITFCALFILLFLSRFASDAVLNWTPVNYFTLKPFIYQETIAWGKIIFGTLITLVYSAVLTSVSYIILKFHNAN